MTQALVTDELLSDITRRIVERVHPRRIVLSGNRARGDTRADSDIDLFIEMESGKRPSERASDVQALFGLRPWSMDVLVCAPEELRRSRGNPGSLVASIGTEGGGELSVLDVHAARDAAARAERVRAWATHDDGIRRWARPVLR